MIDELNVSAMYIRNGEMGYTSDFAYARDINSLRRMTIRVQSILYYINSTAVTSKCSPHRRQIVIIRTYTRNMQNEIESGKQV